MVAAPSERLSDKLHLLLRGHAYRTRFAAGARAAGIAFAPAESRPRFALGAAAYGAIALIAIAGYELQQSAARYRSLATDYAVLKQEIRGLRERPTLTPAPVPRANPPAAQAKNPDDAAWRDRLARTQQEPDQAQASVLDLYGQLSRGLSESEGVRGTVAK